MDLTTVEDLRAHVDTRLKHAEAAANQMQLTDNYRKSFEASATEMRAPEREMIHEIESFAKLPVGYGRKLWAAILFVDLRNSSKRALELGERSTYMTMHAFIHGVAKVANSYGGHIVGFRGDGLFTAFGISDQGTPLDDLDHGNEVRNAINCGRAMIEAVDDAIIPELERRQIQGGLQIGVGIDAFEVMITKIGLFTGHEVTAYGHAVDKAAKLADVTHGEVLITSGAKKIVPTIKGGKLKIRLFRNQKDTYNVEFPQGYRALKAA